MLIKVSLEGSENHCGYWKVHLAEAAGWVWRGRTFGFAHQLPRSPQNQWSRDRWGFKPSYAIAVIEHAKLTLDLKICFPTSLFGQLHVFMSMWGDEYWVISPKATQAHCSAWELESLYCSNFWLEIIPPLSLQIYYSWSAPASVNGVKYSSVASIFNTAVPKLQY